MMHPLKVRFVDSESTTIAELDLHAIPRVGETVRFRPRGDTTTTLTVKQVTYTLADPNDPPAEKEPFDAEVVLALTAANPTAVQVPAPAPAMPAAAAPRV